MEPRWLPAPTLSVQSATITASEGAAIATSTVVATFSDQDAVSASNFTATIDFGDGTAVVTGTATATSATTYTVTPTLPHTFPEESSSVVPPFAFNVTVTVHDILDNVDASTISSALVNDAALHQGNPITAGSPTPFTGTATAGATTALNNFETAIGGVNNGGGPAATSGFRTINWDAVKLDGTDFGGGANTTVISQGTTVGIPLDRFQSRGVFFGAVYAVSGNGFTTVNPSTSSLFPAFSPNNTFAMFNDNGIDFKFVQPSAGNTALVSAASRGFGAIFINVELPNTSFVEYFHNGTSLGKFAVPVGGQGQPSFLGELFNAPIVTNVVLTLGTDVLFKFDGTTFSANSADNPGAGHNLTVVDDWAYAEPVPVTNSFPIVDGPAGTSATTTIASAHANLPFTGIVGSFSDDDPAANARDYTATINWGDGHLTNGTITANKSGGFDVSGTNTYAAAGLFPVAVDVMDFGGGPGPGGSAPSLAIDNTVKVVGHVLATGADAGGGPEVKVIDPANGILKMDFFAYNPAFGGGVRVAVGDVNGDGVPDIITGPGPGGGPEIKVFDGASGAVIRDFFAFSPNFTSGVFVATGDVNGDGFSDIIVGADAGGGPQVSVFSGKDGSVVFSFFAFDPNFLGGVRVAAGDVNGDGFADIITAAGAGGGPQVSIFSGKDLSVLRSFFAFSPTATNGVYVGSGDVNGDGKADIVTGLGAGIGGPEVKVFDGATITAASPAVLDDFFAYTQAFLGGARVAALDVTGDGKADIITGAGPGGGPNVRIFNGVNGTLLPNVQDNFFPFDPNFGGGVFVGGG
jgi:hypothetical protein